MPAISYDKFASKLIVDLFKEFDTDEKGLTSEDALARIEKFGYNEPAKRKKRTVVVQFFSKFLNPLVIVLIIIGVFSITIGDDTIGAFFVLAMVLLSVLLSFFQE